MWNTEDLSDLATALSKFQGEVNNVAREKEGHNYKYADLAAILHEVRPLLSKHGLSVVQTPGVADDGQLSVSTMLLHSSGQWIKEDTQIPMDTTARMSAPQQAGTVISYARRYALAAVLGIAQEDNDGADHQITEEKTQPKKTAKPKTDWATFCKEGKEKIKMFSTEGQLRAWQVENESALDTLALQDNALYQDLLKAWKDKKSFVQNNPQPAVTMGEEPDADPATVLSEIKEKIAQPETPGDDEEIPF